MEKTRTEQQIQRDREKARKDYYKHIEQRRARSREYQRAKRQEHNELKEQVEALKKQLDQKHVVDK